MLRLLLLFVGIAHAQTVDTNKYLTFATPQAASIRSQQQCTAVNCNGVTRCWWTVVQLSDGTGALRVQPSGPYGSAPAGYIGACAVGCGLTLNEINSLQTAVQLGSLLTGAIDANCP